MSLRRRDIYNTRVLGSEICLFTTLHTGGIKDGLTIAVYQSPASYGGWVTFAYCFQTKEVIHYAHDTSGPRPDPTVVVIHALEEKIIRWAQKLSVRGNRVLEGQRKDLPLGLKVKVKR